MIQKNRSQFYFDCQTAADKAALACPRGAEILELNCSVIGADAGGCTIEFNSVLAGTRATSNDVGVLTIPASDQSGQTIQEIPSSVVRIGAGGSVVIEVSAEGVTTLPVVVEIVWKDLGEFDANTANVDAG